MSKDHSLARWPLLCGVLTTPVGVVFVIAASLVTPGYSHLSDTISHLGAQDRPRPEVMNAGLIVLGLLMNGFGYGLYRRLEWRAAGRLVGLAWVAHGMGLILSAIYQGDSRTLGGPVTAEGTAHLVFVISSFAALELGIVGFGIAVYSSQAWRVLARLGFLVALVNLALALAFVLKATEQFDGVLERIFYSTSLLLVGAISLRFLRATGRHRYRANSRERTRRCI